MDDQFDFAAVCTWLKDQQDRIISGLEKADGQKLFLRDSWQREGKLRGLGISSVLEGGAVFEKGGVNYSEVAGDSLPSSATAHRPELAGRSYRAAGISLVMHPENPYVPTTHANVRVFCAEAPGEKTIWWFGGGYDLTPYYGFDEDCQHWHATAKNACDPFGAEVYPKFKNWCDEYFFLKHRGEPRGIGGLFYDDLNEWGFERSFAFMRSVGDSFLPAYLPLVERRKNTPFGEREKEFQECRRGRYVEFNLVYDRGTLFGLQSGGRTESILMSLPSKVRWQYMRQEEPGSAEAELYSKYLVKRDWV